MRYTKSLEIKLLRIFFPALLLIISTTVLTNQFYQNASAIFADAISQMPFAGSGTKLDPYIIMQASDLTWITNNNTAYTGFSGVYFKQGGDIALSDQWTPIGDPDTPFNGVFDGNGHTVTGITYNGDMGSGIVYISDYSAILAQAARSAI